MKKTNVDQKLPIDGLISIMFGHYSVKLRDITPNNEHYSRLYSHKK